MDTTPSSLLWPCQGDETGALRFVYGGYIAEGTARPLRYLNQTNKV